MNSGQLHKKAERIGGYLLDKLKLNTKDYVALIFHPGIDLISAFYGCLYAGELASEELVRKPLH